MIRKTRNSTLLVISILFFLSAACQLPTAPLAEATQIEPSPSTIAATKVNPGLSPTPPIIPTLTQPAKETQQPTNNPPADTPIPSKMITSANASNLVASSPLALPEWPERLLWPAPSLNLPGNPSPRPVLMTNSGAHLYPVVIDLLGIGAPIDLPLNGNRVMAFAKDGTSLVVQDPSQTGLFTIDGKKLWIINNPQQPYGVVYSGDGRFLAVTSNEKMAATIYETASGNEIKELSGFETAAPVYSVLISPGGKTVAWFARATLQFQDVGTGQLGNQISFEDFIGSILYRPDGQEVALTAAGKLLLYNAQTGVQTAQVTLSEPLRALDFSPDGNLLVGIYGQSVQFWDGKTLAPVATIPSATPLSQLSFSPDGQQIATVSDDQNLVFWHLP
jgi:WD40 repeat protein